MLGVFGYPVFLAGSVLAMFNVVNVTHGAGMLALVPGGLFELLLPIWIFTKGFTSGRIEGSTMTIAPLGRQSTVRARALPMVEGREQGSSVRKASMTAGAGLLLMSVLSGFGYFVAVKGLAVPGNATLSRLVGVLGALGTNRQPSVLSRISCFTNIWDAGLVLFGLHLLVIAYLAYRSGYVPKVLGVLLAVAGLGYLFDSLSVALTHGSSTPVSSFTFFGEFLLALWLVIFGRRVTLSDSTSLDSQIVVAQ